MGDQESRTPPVHANVLRERRARRSQSGQSTPRSASGHRPIYKIGGSVIRDGNAVPARANSGNMTTLNGGPPATPRDGPERTIRFPDEEPAPANVATDKAS